MLNRVNLELSPENALKEPNNAMLSDTKFSELKSREKEQILKWLEEELRSFCEANHSFPEEEELGELCDRVYEKVLESGIALSYPKLMRQFKKRLPELSKTIAKDTDLKIRRKREIVSLTNLCMIEDGKGNVVAMDKKYGRDIGTTFPGGHRETNETFHDAVVREVLEETGLSIEDPVLCGIYHWERTDVHHIIFLYKAEKFTGRLKSSKEGEVYWCPLKDFRKKKDLSLGLREVLGIFCDGKGMECYKQFGALEREVFY